MAKIDRRRKSATNHVNYIDFRKRLDGWMETLHLLRSPANARRLLASVASANAGKLRESAISDL